MADRIKSEFRRVFLKFAVLKIISERPSHGYDIIKTIEARSSCQWTPSAGSIYPILECLEENGYIRSAMEGRKKIYTITPDGTVELERMTEENRQLVEKMTRFINTFSLYFGESA